MKNFTLLCDCRMLLSIYRPNKYLYLSERVSYWGSEVEGGEFGFVDFAEAEGDYRRQQFRRYVKFLNVDTTP